MPYTIPTKRKSVTLMATPNNKPQSSGLVIHLPGLRFDGKSFQPIVSSPPTDISISDPLKGTSLVHLKRSGGVEVVSCDVYIGRQQYQGGWKLPRSPFYNPYSVKQYGLVEALRLYRCYIMTQPELLAQLGTLIGKRLGCWCTDCSSLSNPSDYVCHGQILMELIADRVIKGQL